MLCSTHCKELFEMAPSPLEQVGKGQNIIKEQPVFRLTAFRSFIMANNSPARLSEIIL